MSHIIAVGLAITVALMGLMYGHRPSSTIPGVAMLVAEHHCKANEGLKHITRKDNGDNLQLLLVTIVCKNDATFNDVRVSQQPIQEKEQQ